MRMIRDIAIRAGVAIVPVFLAACGAEPDDVPLPRGARAFAPPPVYVRWLAEVRRCSDAPTGAADVRWYEVDGDYFEMNGRMVFTHYDPRANRVVIASAMRFDGSAIRHEMLHAVTRSSTHSRSLFLGTCAHLVTCPEDCLADAGPPPREPAGAIRVPLAEMPVTLDVTPAALSRWSADDFLIATIVVRNTRAVPVVVQTPTPWGGPDSRGFGYAASTDERSEWWDEPMRRSSVLRFAPGETKRWQIDLRAANFPDGALRVRGHYLRRWSDVVQGTITP